eukprot:11200255-Lingulodinium_polyedra.AAC.1
MEEQARQHAVIAGSRGWAGLPRLRMLISTLPPDPEPWRPVPRDESRDLSWRPCVDGQLEPVMRARGELAGEMMGPTY